MPLFEIVETREAEGGHVYLRLVPPSAATLADDLAARITGAYFETEIELQRLRDAATELRLFHGDALAPSEAEISEALAELRDAFLPAGWDGRRPKHTDVQRSELAEIVSVDVLTSVFATVVPASRTRHKEIPDQQARGADVVGFEDIVGFTDANPVGSVTLVLGEVKGSTSPTSPPSVVASMATKLTELASSRRALIQEATWLRDYAEDGAVVQCGRVLAAFLLRRLEHRILLAPVLMRSSAVAAETDTGVFETSPESFDPSRIRFITVVVDGDLFDLAAGAYLKARAALQAADTSAPLSAGEGDEA